ncbi:MAG TPA: hypothetical protein VIY72_15155 [Acidimicrobiales bacterium]
MSTPWRLVALVAALVAVTVAVAGWWGMDPQPLLLAALTVAVVAAAVGLRALRRSAAPAVVWPQAQPVEEEHRIDWQVAALRTRVAFATTDQDSGDRLREALVALVDDRLTGVYGVDRRTDPQAARAILGDELSRFVDDGPSRSRWRRRDLERIVAGIEGL